MALRRRPIPLTRGAGGGAGAALIPLTVAAAAVRTASGWQYQPEVTPTVVLDATYSTAPSSVLDPAQLASVPAPPPDTPAPPPPETPAPPPPDTPAPPPPKTPAPPPPHTPAPPPPKTPAPPPPATPQPATPPPSTPAPPPPTEFNCAGDQASDVVFVHSCVGKASGNSVDTPRMTRALIGLYEQQPPGGTKTLTLTVSVNGTAKNTPLRVDVLKADGYQGPTGKFNFSRDLAKVNASTAYVHCGPVEGQLSGALNAGLPADYNVTQEVPAPGDVQFNLSAVLPLTGPFFVRVVAPTPCNDDDDCTRGWGCEAGQLNVSRHMPLEWS